MRMTINRKHSRASLIRISHVALAGLALNAWSDRYGHLLFLNLR